MEELAAKKLAESWAASGALIPFKMSGGSKKASIVIVGEAMGEHDAKHGHPFLGYSGIELARMLGESYITPPFTPTGFISEIAMMGHWGTSKLFLTNAFAASASGEQVRELVR